LGYLFWYHRGSRLLPTTAAERELWTIWIGYLLAYPVVIVTARFLDDYLDVVPGVSPTLEEMLPYPFLAVISGLAFFTMGSNYWGRCYALGLGFILLAPIMTFHMDWAPLEFGLAWAGALVILGRHLQRLGQEVAMPNSGPTAPTVREKPPPGTQDSSLSGDAANR